MDENKEAPEDGTDLIPVHPDASPDGLMRMKDGAVMLPATTQAIQTATLVAMARDPQIDTAKLQALIDLQERMEAREARRAFIAALAQFKADCPSIISKDAVVDFAGAKGRTYYRHASIGNVVATVTPHLSRYGLSLTWAPVQADGIKGGLKMRTTLTHVLGHSESVELEAPRDESGNKNAIQSVGSTGTYLQRYGALMLLGLATSEHDDDGHSSPRGETRNEKPAPQGKVERSSNDRAAKAIKVLSAYGLSTESLERHVGANCTSWTPEHYAQLSTLRALCKEAAKGGKAKLRTTLISAGLMEREPGQEG